MIVTQIFEAALNIENCINLYTSPNIIEQIVTNRYERRCYRGCFILKITQIRKTGECIITQDGEPKFGTIPVIFEAQCLVYSVGEIVNGCVVKNRDPNGLLVCQTEYAAIMLMPGAQPTESITKDQIISVQVAAAKYSIGSDRVALCATLYLPNSAAVLYKIVPDTRVDVGELTADVMTRIAEEEAELESLRSSRAWTFFDTLLYPFKIPQATPAGAKLIDMKTLTAPTTSLASFVYLSRDPAVRASTPSVCAYTGDKKIVGELARESIGHKITFPNLVLLFLEQYCAHLRTLREMTAIYSDEKVFESHRNLWRIFQKVKM
jgi:hypothetical protein